MSTLDNSYQRQVQLYYLENHGWIRAWLNRKLGNASDAADLAHDVPIAGPGGLPRMMGPQGAAPLVGFIGEGGQTGG
ncbi:hypothetical protein D3C76_1834960 [compost metagenome]|jgi:DNA-directed RNA polymerase specialized sigma24 family protein